MSVLLLSGRLHSGKYVRNFYANEYVLYIIGIGQILDPSDIFLVDSDIKNKSNSLTDIFGDWSVCSSLSFDPTLLVIKPHQFKFATRENSEDNKMYR